MSTDDFYIRYYVGHQGGSAGKEFLEFEFKHGVLRYANNSSYKTKVPIMIRKECTVGPMVMKELKRIVEDSEIIREDDNLWPEPDEIGRQEFELVLGDEHISFSTAKIGCLADVEDSKDADGLKCFYYLVQDLKCMVYSLLNMHFKIKPY